MKPPPPAKPAAEKICVAVRVRGRRPAPRGGYAGDAAWVEDADGGVVAVAGGERFACDRAFGQGSTQREVYEAVVEPLVETWAQGYNACVFAYGQTGSGKTFTMLGPDGARKGEVLDGLIPQAAAQIFSTIEKEEKAFEAAFSKACRSQYRVRATYVEVYNNEVRDLLAATSPSSSPQAGGSPQAAAAAAAQVLRVKEDAAGAVFVDGAVEREVCSAAEVAALVREGATQRATGRTDMNEHSSRSHAVLRLVLEHRWRAPGDPPRRFRCTLSQLHLVDLAGSERNARSGARGAAFKESIAINSGLLALGKVMEALAAARDGAPRPHVPYRDSTLTRLLQSSLAGEARTAMLACVSPLAADADETAGTLRYAAGARRIRVRPTRAVAVGTEEAGPLDDDVQDPVEFLSRRCAWVETPGHGDVFVRCVGDAADPLILFVHGSGPRNSGVWWNGLVHELAVTSPQPYYMVAIDCPGYGASPGDKQTIRSEPGALLEGVLRGLGRTKAHAIVGSSQGSCSAFNAVLERPHLAEFIVVMDPVGHDVFRYKKIAQPTLLIFDVEDAGHPVKVGRWMRDALQTPRYHEFSSSKPEERFWHVDNMAARMRDLFCEFPARCLAAASAAVAGGASATRLAGGLVKWCEGQGTARDCKQITPDVAGAACLQSPSQLLKELTEENRAAAAAGSGPSDGAAAAAAAAGGDEWVAAADQRCGKMFYHCRRTGETRWKPPVGARIVKEEKSCDGGGGGGGGGSDEEEEAVAADLFVDAAEAERRAQEAARACVESAEDRAAREEAERAERVCGVCADLLWEPLRFAACRHAVCAMCCKRSLVRYTKACPVCAPALDPWRSGGVGAGSGKTEPEEETARHMRCILGDADEDAVAARRVRQKREEAVWASTARVVFRYGNRSDGDSPPTVTAFVSVAKAEGRVARAKTALPAAAAVAVKTAEFDINPRYPKSAVRVSTAPLCLTRTMLSRFPCDITLRFTEASVPAVRLPHTICHEAVTVKYACLVLPATVTHRGKAPVCIDRHAMFPEAIIGE